MEVPLQKARLHLQEKVLPKVKERMQARCRSFQRKPAEKPRRGPRGLAHTRCTCLQPRRTVLHHCNFMQDGGPGRACGSQRKGDVDAWQGGKGCWEREAYAGTTRNCEAPGQAGLPNCKQAPCMYLFILWARCIGDMACHPRLGYLRPYR